ncbi:MAG: isopentenyl-diphosphate delta-isomerase, partial [Brevibacterium aurantiacum]|nr:isopentenyl-diphosphate delta-isomerase [Brevibacterium aurantiacum]
PNPAEVAETQWTTVAELATAIDSTPWAFSPWLVEHFPELAPHIADHITGSGFKEGAGHND